MHEEPTTTQGADMTATATLAGITTTDVTIAEHTVTVTLLNGWPYTPCWKCGGTGYLPGYEFSDNARCWGCHTRGGESPASTRNAKAKHGATETGREAAITAQAKAEVRKIRDRVKAAEKAEAERLVRIAERDAAWAAAGPVFDEHPAAVDATYYSNLIEAGADSYQVKGYAYIADRWMDGKTITARMCEIAAETTAKIIARTEVGGLEAGKQRIEGLVKSIKWVDTSYGYRRSSTAKIVVELAGGQRVYGTCPAAILDQAHKADGVVKGARIALTATVEVSDDDPTFGFFSNPSKPELIEAGTRSADDQD